MRDKLEGVVCLSVRRSSKILYLEILASDSVYYKGMAVVVNNIAKGSHVSFFCFIKNERCFFQIEDINNFFGYYFWESERFIKRFSLLLEFCSKNLPAGACKENLYSKFMLQVKAVPSVDFDLEEFKKWVRLE